MREFEDVDQADFKNAECMKRVIGVDEAGRGPLCGPVVACAFTFREDDPALEVRDSKELTALKRQELFERLQTCGLFSLGLAGPREIDRLNILQATMLAFQRALTSLFQKDRSLKKHLVIVDGNYFRTELDIRYKCVKRADALVREVSAASIIAKVFRDHLMGVMDCLYPEWGFKVHKGYPTHSHREILKKNSPTPFHRKSFCPKDE